ncbi:chitinase-3-like protein 2 [Littorina saxatilis]|uniref:GH18 domain-containing protein n=1 Tax=Littorina saxatilis TaxID=31220 RepID=A0AAN9BX75_9CAEN
MNSSPLVKSILLLLCLVESQGKAFIRLCYFPNWSNTRQSEYARFDIDDIDPTLCTHLVYAFAAVDVDSHRIVPMSPATENPSATTGKRGRYEQFNDLKRSYPHLKTLLSIGGEYAGSDNFVAVTRNDRILQRFSETTVDLLRKRGFDGLDVDWEYPNATTKANFSKLLKALRTAFEADRSGRERLILTAALPAGSHHIDTGYDMGALTRYLDLANLMTYDYHGSWNAVTGFDSPLFSRQSDPNFDAKLSTAWTVEHYMSKGLQADKIVVGVTAAGTRFKLNSTDLTGVGAPVIKSDTPRQSDIWQLPDRYAYPEICRLLQSTHTKYVFDEEQQVPYIVLDDEWVGYEDVKSLTGKVDWMMKKGVAGAMFWALDMDDFTGRVCDKGKFPLLKALSHSVGKIENTHLTKNVNTNIRYLTKYTGAASPLGGGAWGTLLTVVVAVLVLRFFR